jgi:hypothetical protein
MKVPAEPVLLEAFHHAVDLEHHVLAVAVAADIEAHAACARSAVDRDAGDVLHGVEQAAGLNPLELLLTHGGDGTHGVDDNVARRRCGHLYLLQHRFGG